MNKPSKKTKDIVMQIITLRKSLAGLILMALALQNPAMAQVKVDTRIGELEFTHDFAVGYPTDATVKKVYDEMDFQRASQAYMWSVPLIGFVYWQTHQQEVFGTKNGQLLYINDYDERLAMLTLNGTTPYVTGFVDLQESGPMVIDMPLGEVRGAASDMWQIQMTQLTRPGKYLFIGPNQEVPFGAEEEGYIINHSPMNNFFVGFRLMSKDKKTRDALLNKVKIYPFSERKNPKQLKPIVPGDKKWKAHQPRTMAYWEALSTSINREPVREMDRYFMAMLKPLGFEKGKPFKPDARQKKILMDALLVGEAMAKVNDHSKRLKKAHYRDGSHWEFATTANWDSRTEYYQELDGTAAWLYEAVTNDKSMHGQETGWGQVYMSAYKDADGDWLDGATDYTLHMPANPPAKTFWSITVYDISTRTIIDNKIQRGDLTSLQQPALQKNKDGSFDLYFGPEAPKGKESNWVQTVPGRAWWPYFRLYSPTQPFLDQTWVIPDIAKVK
jgi:hypothetical protein